MWWAPSLPRDERFSGRCASGSDVFQMSGRKDSSSENGARGIRVRTSVTYAHGPSLACGLVHSGGADDAEEGGGSLTAIFAAGKEPVLSAERDAAQRAFAAVVVDLQGGRPR